MNTTVFHGGRLDLAIAEYGGRRDEWIDLSTGINPNPYPIGELDPLIWRQLPDQSVERELLTSARGYYGVREDMGIVAANGTQALIELLPTIMPSQNIAIVSPTYGEHEHTWLKAGCHVENIGKNDALPLQANALVVVNPNNPDGYVHSIDALKSLASTAAKQHGYLIVDEAFCDATPEASFVSHMPDNVMIYRSFGKFFGLAGLRLGFLIGNPVYTRQLQNLLGPWCISGPALDIGARAFKDKNWIASSRQSLKRDSERQAKVINDVGLSCDGINPLFLYTKHPKAREIQQELAKRKILVRPFAMMKERLRFGLCKDDSELERLRYGLVDILGAL